MTRELVDTDNDKMLSLQQITRVHQKKVKLMTRTIPKTGEFLFTTLDLEQFQQEYPKCLQELKELAGSSKLHLILIARSRRDYRLWTQVLEVWQKELPEHNHFMLWLCLSESLPNTTTMTCKNNRTRLVVLTATEKGFKRITSKPSYNLKKLCKDSLVVDVSFHK